MSNYTIPRSQASLKVQQAIILTSTIAVALLAFLLARLFYRLTPSTRWYAGILTFIIIIAIGYISMLIFQKKWQSVGYRLTPESIVIISDSGFTGTSREVYLYESIISATMTQNFFGKKYGYGDIVLVIPKLDSTVLLKDLADPKEQLNVLGSRLENKINRQTLVT